ncbi:TIGR03943 family protein [Paenibacillus sp. FSL H7-0326]|uniref:TIGR03943 family putative permease subunit n=1 Tax=Paenibacillus sp. FSL H7-0326 TaxID=1921144 RepID=UPI0009F8E137|nr:TIGR03943 family protein [Paenibacillus sp. FSL H7-0326]
MNIKWNGQQLFRAGILLLFSIMLFQLHFTGEILKFVNPKYEPLSLSAAVLFACLFLIQLGRGWDEVSHEHNLHEHGHHEHIDHEHNHHEHEHHEHEHHEHLHHPSIENQDDSMQRHAPHHCGDDHCHHDHGDGKLNYKKLITYAIIIFPLAAGFLVPPQVLNASIADKKGGLMLLTGSQQNSEATETTQSTASNGELALNTQPTDLIELPGYEEAVTDEHAEDEGVMENTVSRDEFNQMMSDLEDKQSIVMEEHIFASYFERIANTPDEYAGRSIQLSGFVFRDEELSDNQLVISRFLITHCIADAALIGFLAEFPQAARLDEDTWIEATGVIDTTVHNGTRLPMIRITEWKESAAPDQPYVYPLSVRIL